MATQSIQIAIKAETTAVWDALVDGSVTPAYYVGFEADFGDLTPGSPYRYTAGGGDMITGTVVDVVPGQRLQTTFNGHWDPAVDALPESSVTFTVFEPFMPMPGITFLSCRYYLAALEASGILQGASGLQPPGVATTVRVRDGSWTVHDETFADPKEHLGGYFLIEVADLDEALRWAERCPSASYASVELRPVLPPPAA